MFHSTTVVGQNVIVEGEVFTGPYCALGQPGFQHAPWSTVDFSAGSTKVTTLRDGFRLLGFGAICAGTTIGYNFRGDFHVVVGEDCQIGDNVVVEYGGRIYDRCAIGAHCVIGGFLCNDARVGDGCVVQGSLVHKRTQGGHEVAPKVERGSFIGANAVVIGDVVVGEECVIGAGAIVTRNTDPGYLYVGVPARRVKRTTWV